MSQIKHYLDYLQSKNNGIAYIGGHTYDLNDVDDYVKAKKALLNLPVYWSKPPQPLSYERSDGTTWTQSSIEAAYTNNGCY